MLTPTQLRQRANNMLTMVDTARQFGNRTPYVSRELRCDVEMILSYDVPTERYQVVLRSLAAYPTAEDVCIAALAFGLDPDVVLPDQYRHVEKGPAGTRGITWHCLRFRWRETARAGAPVAIDMSAPCEA